MTILGFWTLSRLGMQGKRMTHPHEGHVFAMCLNWHCCAVRHIFEALVCRVVQWLANLILPGIIRNGCVCLCEWPTWRRICTVIVSQLCTAISILQRIQEYVYCVIPCSRLQVTDWQTGDKCNFCRVQEPVGRKTWYEDCQSTATSYRSSAWASVSPCDGRKVRRCACVPPQTTGRGVRHPRWPLLRDSSPP